MSFSRGFFGGLQRRYGPESKAIEQNAEVIARTAKTATNMAMNFFPEANKEEVYFGFCDLFNASAEFNKVRAATDPGYGQSMAFETGAAVAEHAFYDNPRVQNLVSVLVELNTPEGLGKFNDLMAQIDAACFDHAAGCQI